MSVGQTLTDFPTCAFLNTRERELEKDVKALGLGGHGKHETAFELPIGMIRMCAACRQMRTVEDGLGQLSSPRPTEQNGGQGHLSSARLVLPTPPKSV